MPQIGLGALEEPLVENSRLERIFYSMQQLVTMPDGTEFATFIQDPNEREETRMAVFLVTSPHPRANTPAMKRAKIPPRLVTVSAMPHDRWREMEKDHRHYAFLTDPLRPIFAGLLRRHMSHIKNMEGME